MFFVFQNLNTYELLLLGSGEGEEEQERGPLFSVGYVLAALCPSSHPQAARNRSTEADTGSNTQNNMIKFYLACLLQALGVCGM